MKPNRWAALAATAVTALAVRTPSAAADSLVPKGFAPASTSWTGPLRGFVLGFSPCGKPGWCASLLSSTDGGKRWRLVGAPPISLPDNHNQVKLTVIDEHEVFLSDGNRLLASHDGGGTWSGVRLAGIREPFYISKITEAGARVFAMVTGFGSPSTTTLYAGPSGTRVLTPVPGFTVTGSATYGDVATSGGVQVSMGSDYRVQKYWTSSDGLTFTAAPPPCPADSSALLSGIRQGRVLALCSGGPGTPHPGATVRRLWRAPKLGGRFTGTAQAPTLGINQSFSAASPAAATVAAEGGGTGFLHSTVDGGVTWKTTELSGRGVCLNDLDFPDERAGVVVDGLPDAAGGSAVYRTVDGGRTWRELVFK
ncbi:sialidase family protein [Amycolatopsis speibonae]|uniref:Photosynthesis system II assembly factor Ycf48/Hcf136-like domain-containing protein n=1 Tax=Amycolatopsis speibonae TaxID=1450224 RepID=A0ABV7NQY8_9PSEU